MSITRRHFCAGLLLGALPLRTIAAPRTLTLGLFPNLPVNKLVEILKGELAFQSEYGKGTTVSFTIPTEN